MLKRMFLVFPVFMLLLISVVKAGCIESIGYPPAYPGIDPWCSLPGNVCQQGDGIFGTLKTTGCPSTPSVQIEIKGDGCSITDTFSAGRYYCSGPGCWYEYLWYIPQLPSGCLGKIVTVTVTSEGVSASKTIKLSTDSTRDNPPTMPKPGEWSVSPIYSTDKVSYTAYAEDDKGLKEIKILAMINGQPWTVVKVCSVSGTSASCTYTGGPYPADTEVCFKGAATDTRGQEASSTDVGARAECQRVLSPPHDTDNGKNYTTKGVCIDTRTWEDFCPWEGPRGYCCGILPGYYWHVINLSTDGTVTCCRTSSPKPVGGCLETRIINCKNVLGEYYPSARECSLELYDCSKEGKTCFNGACVSGIPTNFSFYISVDPSSGFVFQGDRIITQVKVALVSGTAQPVSLSCSNLPSGVSCSFSVSRCYPPCDSTLLISVATNVPEGNYPITIKGEGGGIVQTVDYNLVVIPKVMCAPSCIRLINLTSSKFGSKCGDATYDPVADVNKDKVIDMRDIASVTPRCNDDVYCQFILQNKTNPCTAPPEITLTCGECTVGRTCECSISGTCTSGLWVLTSRERALAMPIVSDIPPTRITYNPVKGGVVKVLAVCFEPAVVVKRVEVNVKSGMLSCPETCFVNSPCTCSVSDCSSGIFVATGKPLDSPVVEDVTGAYSTSFTPSREGTIKAIAVCFEPTVKVERSSISVLRR